MSRSQSTKKLYDEPEPELELGKSYSLEPEPGKNYLLGPELKFGKIIYCSRHWS